MSASPVRLELGRVSRLVLNRPDKHNAMTVEMGEALRDAVARIDAEPGVRVVLVTGEGRAFSAGGDFAMIEANASRPAEENRRNMVAFYSLYLSIMTLRVPTIAVLHGAAVGAGLCLALACDLRIAAREAKLGANFVRVGLHPGMGCSLLLPHVVGPARAAEMLYTGRLVLGDEAERIGLVARAVARDEIGAAAEEWAQEIAGAAPIAVAQLKSTLSAGVRAALVPALEREAACQAIDFGSEDLMEAVRAFRDGRAPAFSGR